LSQSVEGKEEFVGWFTVGFAAESVGRSFEENSRDGLELDWEFVHELVSLSDLRDGRWERPQALAQVIEVFERWIGESDPVLFGAAAR
jgi:hypothetical protein